MDAEMKLLVLAERLEQRAGQRVAKWTDRPTQSPPMRYRYNEETRQFMADIAAALRALEQPAHPSGRPYASKSEMKRVETIREQPASAAGDAERRRFIDRTGFCIVGDERGYWLWNEKTDETTDGYHSTPNSAIDSAIAAAPKQGSEK